MLLSSAIAAEPPDPCAWKAHLCEPSGLTAWSFPPFPPKQTVPSAATEGELAEPDALTPAPTENVHLLEAMEPLFVTAIRPYCVPRKTVPSAPSAGDETIGLPTPWVQRTDPGWG